VLDDGDPHADHGFLETLRAVVNGGAVDYRAPA
jgi:hypothetical protein